MPERTFVDVLRERAAGPHATNGYTFLADGETDERRMSYAELDLRARTLAAALQARGAADERVLIVCPAGLDFIAALFGCLYAGAIAVPLPPPEAARPGPGREQIQRIARETGASLVLGSTREHEALLELRSAPPLEWLDVAEAGAGDPSDWRPPPLGEGATALLQYTSGSTSSPRGVVLSHANLLANARAVRAAFFVSEDSRGVSWLPPHHDMGLMGGILEPMLLGADTALLSPRAFLERPLRWLRAITRFRATTCGGPTFAYDLLARRVPESAKQALDLSCWKVAFCGAEPVRAETLDAFAQAFGSCGFHKSSFLPCYGLAEATLLVTAGHAGNEPHRLDLDAAALERGEVLPAPTSGASGGHRSFVSCGAPAEGTRIRIVDPASHTACPSDRVGEVWVRGPGVAARYWSDDDATRESFFGQMANGEGPWLRTGDLGFIREGELYLTGRFKDLIVVRGRNLYPQDVEVTVEQAHAAVRPGRAAAFSFESAGEERLVVACELNRRAKDKRAEIAEALRRAVANDHGVAPYAVVAVQPGNMPRTSSGKPRRHACRRLYLEGLLGESL